LVLLVPAFALAIHDMEWFDLNHWRSPFYNEGRWGIDTTQGAGVAGGFWRDTAYIFGAGVWFGALRPWYDTLCDTLTTVGYNPNTGGTECVPTLYRYWQEGYNNPEDRIYKYPGDWPPPLSRFPMAPQRRASEMDFWCCFCDGDPSYHTSPGHPLGIDVTVGVYGFTGPLADDILFLRYDCFNRNDYDTIAAAYIGVVMDPDIGTNATNDLTGLILDRWFPLGPDSFRVRDVGFAYSQDHNPSGAVAVKLMSAPAGLGLSAFKRFSIDYDPTTDWAQYLTMAGYDYRTGEYLPFDSIDLTPADKRFILCTGPFDLPPDSSMTLWYAVIGAPFWNQSDLAFDTTELALRCRAADSLLTVLTGVEEETPHCPTGAAEANAPTIVRGVLVLPGDRRPGTGDRAVLLDISGRKVLNLGPGANDVRALAPGVYFVRHEPSAVSRERSVASVRKVIIAE
jgi:hypothetical protein